MGILPDFDSRGSSPQQIVFVCCTVIFDIVYSLLLTKGGTVLGGSEVRDNGQGEGQGSISVDDVNLYGCFPAI